MSISRKLLDDRDATEFALDSLSRWLVEYARKADHAFERDRRRSDDDSFQELGEDREHDYYVTLGRPYPDKPDIITYYIVDAQKFTLHAMEHIKFENNRKIGRTPVTIAQSRNSYGANLLLFVVTTSLCICDIANVLFAEVWEHLMNYPYPFKMRSKVVGEWGSQMQCYQSLTCTILPVVKFNFS